MGGLGVGEGVSVADEGDVIRVERCVLEVPVRGVLEVRVRGVSDLCLTSGVGRGSMHLVKVLLLKDPFEKMHQP